MISNKNTLYKRNTNGGTQIWTIEFDAKSYWTTTGKLDGKMIVSEPTWVIAKGKHTVQEQVISEVESKIKKQTDKGYYTNLKDIAKGKSFFAPMLAHKYKDYKSSVVFPVLASTKLDGLRMVATKSGLTTRNGKPFNSCPHIHKLLKPVFDKHPDWVVDGEIYSNTVPFEKIVSLTRKKNPTVEELAESEKICQLWIFDGVVDNVNEGFIKRFDILTKEIKSLVGKTKSLKFVENTMVNSEDEIEKLHKEFVKEGYEGIMLRKADSIYENKRSKNLLKYKYFFDEEFIIVDIQEGTGNRQGMAGNVVVSKKTGVTFSAGIKGGEEFYKELLKNKKQYIGKLVTIRYQELTEDKIPRFPIAVSFDPIDR